jgi:hypothetical protein
MADAWPAAKAHSSIFDDGSFLSRFGYLLRFAPVAPMFGLNLVLYQMFSAMKFREIFSPRITNPELAPDTMSICNKLWRAIKHFLVILFGINLPRGFLKSIRIVANTYIVLGMSDSTKLPRTHINADDSPVKEDKMAHALTLGHKHENPCLMEFNEAGKLALLESRILPNYEQLRFLDGRTGIAPLIIGVQAICFVTSIVYRAIQPFPVSPIEAIGFAFSLLVIVYSVRSLGVICQNSRVIYLNPAQEQEMLDKCRSTRWSIVDDQKCEKAGMVGTVVVLSVMVAFTILVAWHVLKISWLNAIGPVLFLLSLILQVFPLIKMSKNSNVDDTLAGLLYIGVMLMSFGGIVVSIVATILNWQTDKFDSRTPYAIHTLPFLD